MKNCFLKTILSVLTLVLVSSGVMAGTYQSQGKRKEKKEVKLTADGPYILYQPDGSARVISVDNKGQIVDKTYNHLPKHFSFEVTDHKGRYPFKVQLHPIQRPDWKYAQSPKTFVMSDPHGRLDCVVSLLQGNGVIDAKCCWSFGKNHLVIIGDVFDRGNDATQIFWLFYKLEAEAAKAGGHVSFLLGNHEPMVLGNDLRYTKEKYTTLAKRLGMRFPQLMGADTELGRWLESRNTMQVIGDGLYVHAGLSKAFYDKNLEIPLVNQEISRALFMKGKERRALGPLTAFLYGKLGPIWYRGLVLDQPQYNPLPPDSLQMILDRYQVKCLLVGHTIFKDVSAFYKGKVIDVNVDNKKNKRKRRGRALLIDGEAYYVVGDKGFKRNL